MLSCTAAALLPGCASLLPGSTWRSVSRQRPAVRHASVLAIEADMKDYVRPRGAPEVRAIDGLSDLNKPVLLYLPGIELSGYTLHSQTQELSEDFALHYLTVGQVGAACSCSPRTSRQSPLTTHHAPRTAHHAPLTTHHAPPTSDSPHRGAGRPHLIRRASGCGLRCH